MDFHFNISNFLFISIILSSLLTISLFFFFRYIQIQLGCYPSVTLYMILLRIHKLVIKHLWNFVEERKLYVCCIPKMPCYRSFPFEMDWMHVFLLILSSIPSIYLFLWALLLHGICYINYFLDKVLISSLALVSLPDWRIYCFGLF